ncbi:RAI1-domain-containing protein [Cystobasidium minutum MCA 4210]|uniref:RAI1-domain-containing protein n=1 Tax=Cystobasidium minutum MCA 4210 TaxID=1397322 RepID=UPI0034CF53B1|eukprot:jgi/Rhomi1/113981/CE113980_1434
MEIQSLQLLHPFEYAHSQPVPLTRPQHFHSFSYGEDRELLVDATNKDASLRWYKQPVLGCDLRFGYERCVWRPEDIDEGLDALLASLLARLRDPSAEEALSNLLQSTAVITWRGMATKLLTALYEEREGFEMNVMMVDGCLYLEEYKSPQKRKKVMDTTLRLQSYYGYAFESYCTSEDPNPPQPTTPEECWSGDVNTNVQWCSIVRTSLGDVPMILGGEVDCVREGAGISEGLDTQDFLELKTNIVIDSNRDEINFERYKFLKHYVQSLLLGVPTVIIGFRQDNGVLAGFQSFETLDIPKLVADKEHVWHASSILNAGHHIFTHILSSLSQHSQVRTLDEQLTQGVIPATDAIPVFRLSFTTANRDGKVLSLRQLTTAEVDQVVKGKTNVRQRAGFVPYEWVQSIVNRKAKRQATSQQLNY